MHYAPIKCTRCGIRIHIADEMHYCQRCDVYYCKNCVRKLFEKCPICNSPLIRVEQLPKPLVKLSARRL